jgi:predicted NAD/FAD-binding protein
VISIERTPQNVIVNDGHGHSDRYDDVVIATHSEPGTPDIGLLFASSISGKIMPGRA